MGSVTTMVPVGRHTLEATVFGGGEPAVVVEPSFGGCARDWEPVAESVAESAAVTVVTYDRSPYGASSPARDARTPHDIADDLDSLLRSLRIAGPLVLVGHSAGGIYMRAYAARHMDRVAGMVLVESSHETQGPVLGPLFSWRERLRTALVVPSIVRESNRSRRGGDRRSIIREWRSFRRITAGQPLLPPGALGDRPLAVLTCAPPDTAPSGGRVWQAWHDLHEDLTRLSANGRHVISESPAHYLNEGDPKLIVSAILDIVHSVRTGTPLGEPAAAAESASDAE